MTREPSATSAGAAPQRGFVGGLIEIFALAVIYYLTARVGLLLAFERTNASPVWPPAGIAFAVLLLRGYRVWPGIFIGAFAANFVVFLQSQLADLVTLGLISGLIGVGNTLEAVLGRFLYRLFISSESPLDRAQDVFTFTMTALIMSVVSASLGATGLCVAGMVAWPVYPIVWFTWWLGDVSGVLVVTPFILAWVRTPRIRLPQQRFVEVAILFILLALATRITLGKWFLIRPIDYPLAFLLIPFLLWTTFRFGHRATVTAVMLVSGIAIWQTIQGFGPFVRESVNRSLLLLQGFVGVVTVTTLAIVGAVTERRRVEDELRKARDELDFRVRERTAELVQTNKSLEAEIGQRRQAVEALGVSEERFRAVVETAQDGVISADAKGNIIYFNPAAERIFGYPSSEVIGKPLTFLMPERFHGRHREGLARYLSTGEAHVVGKTVELAGRRKEGSEFPLELSLASWKIGEAVYFTGIVRDITERNKAERAVRESERRFFDLFEGAPDPIIILDLLGRVQSINPAAEQISGYQADELVGKHFATAGVLMTEALPVALREFALVVSGKQRTTFELEMIRKDGSAFTVEANPRLIRREGKATGVQVIFRDVTERKRDQSALVQKTGELARTKAEREQLELFAFVASHDLQEPLQKIIAFGDLLREQGMKALGSKPRSYIERMQNAATRMSELIESLLQFSRVTAAREVLGPVNLERVVNEALSDLELKIAASGTQVEIGSLPTIVADRPQMQLLFQNLIANAIKFRNKDETPRISIQGESLDEQFVEITVKDNGIGFDEKYLDRVFKPFERLHTQGEYEGSGMGLAICQRIVVRHGGRIFARSAPGKGSTFIITLPVSQ